MSTRTHSFRILSATLLISEILAANSSKYAAYAISNDRDNGNDGVRYLENNLTTVWLHGSHAVLSRRWQAYSGRQ